MVRQIVNRCHVGSDFLAVCREVRRAMNPAARRDPALRESRRCLWSQAIRFHGENRELCAAFRL